MPVYGKTYSLYGQAATTEPFYRRISHLTDEVLARLSLPENQALAYIQSLSCQKLKMKRAARKTEGSSGLTDMMQLMDGELAEYLPGLRQHLREVPLYKIISDKELFCSREQYYLYMVEFELVNRVHRNGFLNANFRIALLPYCLKESQTDCRASPDEIDYTCRRCLKTCYINRVSKVLREHQVNPYIWSRGSLKEMFRKLAGKHGSIGVLGIACIVELIRGMQVCMKAGLPVMGIPLNANRCARWMDVFHDTSVDLRALEGLLDGKPDPGFSTIQDKTHNHKIISPGSPG
jgi:hypothetical protein